MAEALRALELCPPVLRRQRRRIRQPLVAARIRRRRRPAAATVAVRLRVRRPADVAALLLRHLNSVYKVLSQTVPDSAKTEQVVEMELYLGQMLRQIDSSLTDEWERMRDPNYQPPEYSAARGLDVRPPGAEEAASDITRDAKTFTASIRTRIFTFLRAWSIGRHADALASLDSPSPGADAPWTVERLASAMDAFREEHAGVRMDPEARNLRHTYVAPADEGLTWQVDQVLIDPDAHNDWVAVFEVDLAASRDAGRPVVGLRRIGAIAP